MKQSPDRLYELLPAVYRLRDADRGYPLRALLRVIGEQVDVVEDDIEQLYENWFIETCEDWVVPYIGELIGYQPVHEAGEPGEVVTPQGRRRNKILIPRRDVANTIRYRRRKGTLALLELLAVDVAGWPARAVEFYKLLGWTQALNHLRLHRGRTVDLRNGDALDRLDGPFDELAHTVEVRRVVSHRTQGYYNLPSVGVYVWRLGAYSVTQTPAACLDESPHCYTFSVVGNDTPLYNRPQPETEPTHIAEELNLPTPIGRRRFETHKTDYYGEDKSLQIWVGTPRIPVPAAQIIPADLSDWQYRPKKGFVAVDPERGRIAFPPGHAPGEKVVWVSYHYAFSADIGGGEYDRPLSQPAEHTLYRVGEQEELQSIKEALDRWRKEQEDAQSQPDPLAIKRLQHAVIEITDSRLYEERLNIVLRKDESLQIRAASRKRPVIGLSNVRLALPDALNVQGGEGSRFTLDGLLVLGRAVQISARENQENVDGGEEADGPERVEGDREGCEAELPQGGLAEVIIRHSTLVPGWALECDCQPQHPAKPSLELLNTQARITIEHSIIGAIQVIQDEVAADPVCIRIGDSVLDATSCGREALGAPGCPVAHACLSIARSTVLGQIQTHTIDLAENTIFSGLVMVARRQQGCMRFCSVTPGSRTPRRYNCQPDLAEHAIEKDIREAAAVLTPISTAAEIEAEVAAARERERERVRPQFNSTHYGAPTYCQLAHVCAEEIKRGADDESEMGAFHDLFQPQRAANLRARLEEYTPAGMEAGIVYAS